MVNNLNDLVDICHQNVSLYTAYFPRVYRPIHGTCLTFIVLIVTIIIIIIILIIIQVEHHLKSE